MFFIVYYQKTMYMELPNGMVRALLKTTRIGDLWASFFRYTDFIISCFSRFSRLDNNVLISIHLNGNFAGVTMRQLIIQVGVLSSRRGAGMAQGFLDDTQIFRFLVEQGTAGMAQ